ncbi:MAG: GspL/Epsl periplasmic domain-containing protein [Candidatus Sulfobium sp.]
MSGTAFIDLTEENLTVYLLGKNGAAVREIASGPVGEGYSFNLEGISAGTEDSCLSLPLGLLNFRVVDLPFSDISKIRELLPFELDGLVLGGASGIVFDARILGESSGKSRVLVAYLPKETLKTILNRLKTAGLDPKAVTSVELSHVLATAASEDEITRLLTTPEGLEEKARMERAIMEVRNPAINLRRGELAYTVDTEKTRKSLKMMATLAILVLLVFLSDLSFMTISIEKNNRAVRDEMRRTYLNLFPHEKRITSETYQLEAHIKQLKDKENSFRGISPLDTMLDLSRVRPGMKLSEITMDKDVIVLKGECRSLSDVQTLRDELGGILTDVTISDTRPSSHNGTLFTLTAKQRKT